MAEIRWVVEYQDPNRQDPVWGRIRGWFLSEARAHGYIEEYGLTGARVKKVLLPVEADSETEQALGAVVVM